MPIINPNTKASITVKVTHEKTRQQNSSDDDALACFELEAGMRVFFARSVVVLGTGVGIGTGNTIEFAAS